MLAPLCCCFLNDTVQSQGSKERLKKSAWEGEARLAFRIKDGWLAEFGLQAEAGGQERAGRSPTLVQPYLILMMDLS